MSRPPASRPGEGVRLEPCYSVMQRFQRRKQKHLPAIRQILGSGGTLEQAAKATKTSISFVWKIAKQEGIR